jgi:exodeoxyribonuclease V alpha subunit
MTDIVLDPSQEKAVELALEARVAVITGGPGCGKTTCLRTALDRLDAAGRGSYALAAPTGKAARRLSEATGRHAGTVHRLLEYGPLVDEHGFETGELGFRRNRSNPLDRELVVIDEASMLDVELAAAVRRAINPARTRLLLVGDANQLPSVGPGRVFGDLIESGKVPVARLTHLHRAAAESWVCTQAPVILAGDLPATGDRPDFLWVQREDRDQAASALVKVVTEELPRRGIDAGDIQVLIPQRIGPAGIEALNPRLQSILNPDHRDASTSWKIGPYVVRPRDRVIQTFNDYTLNVMNGEVGAVDQVREKAVDCATCTATGLVASTDPERVELARSIGIEPRETCPDCAGSRQLRPGLVVRFPDGPRDRVVTYSRGQAESLHLAYALTIHKSQGSEWPWVVVLVHSTHTRMLTRQLLYTGITRARKGVVIVGDLKGLERAVRETRDVQRNTGLIERLRAA